MVPMLSPEPLENSAPPPLLILFLIGVAGTAVGGIVIELFDKWFDLKFLPVWAKLGKRRLEAKQRILDKLNAPWESNRAALSRVGEPLRQFNQMDKYPDIYTGTTCSELAIEILKAAEKIDDSPDFADIKKKLFEYGGGKDRICATTGHEELKAIFQRKVVDVYEPFALLTELQQVLARTSTPPYLEEDL